MAIIKLDKVSKFYKNKNNISSGFSKINLELDMGEFVVITGESGSGKSTLLNVISGLDSYEEGEMYINGEETSHYREVDYENYRRKYIGNIFQSFNLVNSYTVYQNIELVLLLNGYKKGEVKEKVLNIIETVGLTKYKNTKVSKLSGGQKQRVAIARALLKDTPIIVADEPTGNLDVKSAKKIMKLLHDISKDKLVIVVTHNYEQVEEYATRKITMHDGKIIEDKNLKEHDTNEIKPSEYKNITLLNKLLLGFRNTFNIKVKFALLFLVYFFLTLFVFSGYSSLRKIDYDNSLLGYNYHFSDTSENRVIINKKDKSSFTLEEIERIKSISNIKSVALDDLFLDLNVSAYDNYVYFYGKASSINALTSVDEGEMPKNANEVVIYGSKDSYYLYAYEGDIIGRNLTIQNNSNGNELGDKVTVVGIKYSDEYTDDYTIYLTSDALDEMRKGLNASYSEITMTVNDNVFEGNTSRMYFRVMPNQFVKDNEVYTFEELEYYCKNYACINNNLNLKIKNIYYEDDLNLKVKKVLNKDNFKTATGLKNFEDYYNTLFISENDYNELFMKDTYQMSVFIEDTKRSDEVLSKLDKMNINTYYMAQLLSNDAEEIGGILNIIRGMIFIIAFVALFFISYFIIKIILKSRNVYYSTIRILGATKKICRNLLNIELFVDVNIAYFSFVFLVSLVKTGIFPIEYIKDMTEFFTTVDFIIVYGVLCVMSLLISNRYASKLFKDSAMNTYREEV